MQLVVVESSAKAKISEKYLGDDCSAHEKRAKRWRREWKFALIERGNPDWRDVFETLA